MKVGSLHDGPFVLCIWNCLTKDYFFQDAAYKLGWNNKIRIEFIRANPDTVKYLGGDVMSFISDDLVLIERYSREDARKAAAVLEKLARVLRTGRAEKSFTENPGNR